MIEINKVKTLLSSTKTLLAQEERLRKLKGEDFNLFSIMSAEYKEDNTHSAIIAELLNPKGSHHKGSLFLKLFLDMILKDNKTLQMRNKEALNYQEAFLKRNVSVTTEFHIGKVDFDLIKGGRIDIILRSGKEIITIENKIFAKDQKLQLERYYNYKTKNNLVYYLTLFGTHPSEESQGNLINENFKCISYYKHIKEWLEKCLMHSHNDPILRESLKQYLLLIKKITHQMTNEKQEELNKLLAKNLKTASAIHHGYLSAKNSILENFRVLVADSLKTLIEENNLKLEFGNPIGHKFSQLWLTPKKNPHPKASFGIESFTGDYRDNGNGKMFYGVFVAGSDPSIAVRINPNYKKDEGCTAGWPSFEWVKTDFGNDLNLTSVDLISRLADDTFAKKQANLITANLTEFISTHIETFNKINQTPTS